jgi:Ca2+/Na+ antiporter
MPRHTDDPLEQVHQSYRHYSLHDGVEELVTGIKLTLMGLTFYALMLRMQRVADGWWSLAAVLTLLVFTLAEKRIREGIRQRVTWPRTGYVSEESGEAASRRRRLLAVLFVVVLLAVAVGLAVLLASGNGSDMATAARLARWAPAVYGVLWGVASWLDGGSLGMVRLRVTGVLIGTIGLAASAVAPDLITALALFLVGTGVVEAVAGAVALRRLAATPREGGRP